MDSKNNPPKKYVFTHRRYNIKIDITLKLITSQLKHLTVFIKKKSVSTPLKALFIEARNSLHLILVHCSYCSDFRFLHVVIFFLFMQNDYTKFVSLFSYEKILKTTTIFVLNNPKSLSATTQYIVCECF